MNPKELISREFIYLDISFLNWLRTLGYSEATISTRKRNLREFLLYLERCGISDMDQAAGEKVNLFVRYLKRRENKLYGSGLMNASINVGISSVNKFFEYLRQSASVTMVPDNLQYVQELYRPRIVLSPEDISSLYEATYINKWFARAETKEYQGAIQQRDRAMLGIYYGCGLRKSEGTNITISDILTERKLVYVRKGKGCKERYVPVTDGNLQHITEYLHDGRNFLLARSQAGTDAFFINQYGGSCSDQALSARLDRLVKNSGSPGLQSKKPTLHTLRHSIATHLLQSGMEIEMIQKFLGHASLESTQIYTHLANEF
ncbi:MAG TPA: tyrosine-type recombinase/integrase [Candidatus Cloacimonadota bacterium]|jgi:integrase/recombinase XerD|nr:tyrosine-type recombinase/integrase [Candidatus Cloacimonadota bacterium]